jgi:hypothetical protein
MSMVRTEMPVYQHQQQEAEKLERLVLPQAEPPTAEAQIESILDLLTYANNRLDTMELLLAALVQGTQITVLNAPRDLKRRVGFVEGLLALLPPPARFGVTFATHTVPSTRIDAQIRFLSNITPPEGALVYDWEAGRISGEVVEDEYSRFIISQLRLDTDLVIKQTEALTAVAAWRIRRGDKLSEALGYASYRMKVDDALLSGMPVEIEDVAKVLSYDTTLTDELQITYSRHLLAVTLALGDTTPANVIAPLMRKATSLEASTLRQLEDALEDGKGDIVYETLERWLEDPLGPHTGEWVELTHRAAIAKMELLAKAGDAESANRFLNELHQAGPNMESSRVVPRLFEMALLLSVQNKTLAQTLFLLAVDYLDSDRLNRLLNAKPFISQIVGIPRVMQYISGEDRGPAPTGLLLEVVNNFDEQWRPLILIRLAELAMMSGRTDMIGTPALAGLVGAALSPWGRHYDPVLRWIVGNLSTDEWLLALDAPGPRYLLQILLARGLYRDFTTELLHQARVLYPGDAQNDYAAMIERIFADTPISVGEVSAALEALKSAGIKALPLIMAHIGALEGQNWNPALDQMVIDLTEEILDNRKILQFVHPSVVIALINFQVRRQDIPGVMKVAALMPPIATRQGVDGAGLMVQVYQMISWDEKAKAAALDLLRRFVRMTDEITAQKAITQFGQELGDDVRRKLFATYTFKRLLGDSDLQDYARRLHVTAQLLHDTAQAYADKNKMPLSRSLNSDLDSITGGVSTSEKEAIAREILGMGRAVVTLGGTRSGKNTIVSDSTADALVSGMADPKDAIEALWVIGGYFARGRRFTVEFERIARAHVLGARSAPSLYEEAEVVNRLLRNVLRAFPPDKEMRLSTTAIREELESMWAELPLQIQRDIVTNLADDFQRVAFLVAHIAANGDPKAMGDSGLGRKLDELKQRPASALEFYRFVHGYFKK